MKSQTVRLIDVFFIGPFIIYMGTREKNIIFSGTSAFIGLATIIYNGFNYINYKKNQDIAYLDRQKQKSVAIGVRG